MLAFPLSYRGASGPVSARTRPSHQGPAFKGYPFRHTACSNVSAASISSSETAVKNFFLPRGAPPQNANALALAEKKCIETRCAENIRTQAMTRDLAGRHP